MLATYLTCKAKKIEKYRKTPENQCFITRCQSIKETKTINSITSYYMVAASWGEIKIIISYHNLRRDK